MNPPPTTYAAGATGPPPRMVYPARRPAPPPTTVPAEEASHDADPAVLAPAAFEDFYEADRERLGRAVAFALGDVDLAAEAIDEAFARAFERWPAVRQVTRRPGCTGWP
ncbi:MAG: hypothetical protein R2746_07145 [Acidimicrobiales bacterium]